MNQIKATLHDFIASLHLYDYIVFGVSGGLFLLILLLAIILRRKAVLSLMLVLLSFIILIALPISGYNYIHAQLYKTELTNLNIKRLEFSEAIVIKGTLPPVRYLHMPTKGQQVS
jgi:glucan phosphoethanolaminetransferase (alkaline phosphatase superfamily)